jgi:hypothetical protein
MEPNGVGIARDEFVDWEAFDRRLAKNSFLLAVYENQYVFPVPLAAGASLGGGQFALHALLLMFRALRGSSEQNRTLGRRGDPADFRNRNV